MLHLEECVEKEGSDYAQTKKATNWALQWKSYSLLAFVLFSLLHT